jgi:hypothetical protein
VTVTLKEYKFTLPALYCDKAKYFCSFSLFSHFFSHSYFIYGGVVFTKLTTYYTSQFKGSIPGDMLTTIATNAESQSFPNQEYVIISEGKKKRSFGVF